MEPLAGDEKKRLSRAINLALFWLFGGYLAVGAAWTFGGVWWPALVWTSGELILLVNAARVTSTLTGRPLVEVLRHPRGTADLR